MFMHERNGLEERFRDSCRRRDDAFC